MADPSPGAGAWGVQPPETDGEHMATTPVIDVCTTRWATMALTIGRRGGLEVGASLRYVEAWWARSLSNLRDMDQGVPGAFTIHNAVLIPREEASEMTAAMAVIGIFIGREPGDALLDSLFRRLCATRLQALHAGEPLVPRDDYPATLVAFRYSEQWSEWNALIREPAKAFVRDPAAVASLRPVDWGDGTSGGATTNQALAVLLLEVYYRYHREPVQE